MPEKFVNRAFDRFLLWIVRRRLARFRPGASASYAFPAAVLQTVRAEFDRRDAAYGEWAKELADREAIEAERVLRAAVLERFEQLAAKGFEPGEQARLQ